jgi:hypothetical protein
VDGEGVLQILMSYDDSDLIEETIEIREFKTLKMLQMNSSNGAIQCWKIRRFFIGRIRLNSKNMD